MKETIKTKNTNEAEMIKLLNNAHRLYSFSFANMTSILAEKYNLNTYDLIAKANYGYSRNPISKPSTGIGGFCLVKDFKILSQSSKLSIFESEFQILNEVNKIIIKTPLRSIKKFEKIRKRKISKILIFGFAFKGVPQQEILITLDKRYHGKTAQEIIDLAKDASNNLKLSLGKR